MAVPQFLASHPIACESSQPTPGAHTPVPPARDSAADPRRGSATDGEAEPGARNSARYMPASSELLQRRMNLSTHLVNPTPTTSVFPTPQASFRPTPAASPAKLPSVAATRPSRSVCRKLTSLYEYSVEDVALTNTSRQRSPSPGVATPSMPGPDQLVSNDLYSPSPLDEAYQLQHASKSMSGSALQKPRLPETARFRLEDGTPASASTDRGLGYWTERAEFWRQRAEDNVKTSQQFVPGSLAGLLSMPATDEADAHHLRSKANAMPLSQSMDTEIYRQMAARSEQGSTHTNSDDTQQPTSAVDRYMQQMSNGSALSAARAALKAAEQPSSDHAPAPPERPTPSQASTHSDHQTPRMDSKRLHEVVQSVKQMKESLRQSQECGSAMDAQYREQLDSELAELQECLATFRATERPGGSEGAVAKVPTQDAATCSKSSAVTVPVSPVYDGPLTPEIPCEQGPSYHSPETKQAMSTGNAVKQPPIQAQPRSVPEPRPRQPGCFGCLFARS